MQRLRNAREDGSSAPELSSAKARADILSDTAETAKRGADALLERDSGRGRTLAGFTAAAGVLALVLASAAALGYGNPHVISLLAGLASLGPTALALSRAAESDTRLREASIERGFCQAVGTYARRLADSVGATDERNIALGPEAIVNGQLDVLFKDLDRSKQRLVAAGAEIGPRGTTKKLHERMVPDLTETVIVTTDGRRYPVWITELSLANVTLRGKLPPLTPSDTVQVGSRKARLAHVAAGRATLHFLTPIAMSEFNRNIVL